MSSPCTESSSESDASASPAERPSQGTFNETEQDFLRKFLDEYLAAESSNTKKGAKKRWVKLHVYCKYIKVFDSAGPDGPNLSSLIEKMARWYSNHAATRGVQSKQVVISRPVKRPRATNAEELFAKSHQEELRTAVQSKMQQDGSESVEPGANLAIYRVARKEAYFGLSLADKAKWEALAKDHNDKIKVPPSADYIRKHQSKIADDAAAALSGLRGNGWGQHGDVVFFLQGAYRDKDNHVKTFHSTVGTPSDGSRNFKQDLDWDKHRSLFKKWASEMLPICADVGDSKIEDAEPVLIYKSNGAPLLPQIKLEDHPHDVIIKLLKEFMTVTWKHNRPTSVGNEIPWDALDMSRQSYLSSTCIPDGVTTMDPQKMSVPEAHLLYKHISSLQDTSECFAFIFTDASNFHSLPDQDPIVASATATTKPGKNGSKTGPPKIKKGRDAESTQKTNSTSQTKDNERDRPSNELFTNDIITENAGSSGGTADIQSWKAGLKKRPAENEEVLDPASANKKRSFTSSRAEDAGIESANRVVEGSKRIRVQKVKTGVVDLSGQEYLIPKKNGKKSTRRR